MYKFDKKKMAELLNTDEVRSKIIADASYFDFFLGFALSMYFSPPIRSILLYESVINGLSFGKKLQILSNIPFKQQYKSLDCISTLKQLQKLRNHLAHSYFTIHIDKIFKDTDSLRLLVNYPTHYDSVIKIATHQFRRLTSVREFLEAYKNTKAS